MAAADPGASVETVLLTLEISAAADRVDAVAEAAEVLPAAVPAGAVEIVLLTLGISVVADRADLVVEAAAALAAVDRATSVQARRLQAAAQQMPQAHREMPLMQTVREVAVPLA